MSIPILIWVFVLLYYSVNLPWFDDFDPFPDFLHKWIGTADFSDRLTLLFQPNNEHRMIVGKLVTLGYYWVTGHLNFTFLHIAGAFFTFGTLLLFWQAFKRTGLSFWYFLPVPFLLFQLQFHLAFLWAICSLQHPPVVFFATLSMFLMARNRFFWAVVAGILATYAMSSGIFVWPAGVVVLLVSSRYKELLVWCGVAVLSVGFYFYGMSAQGNESSFAFFLNNPHLTILGFFTFLGGLFDFFPEKSIEIRSTLPVLMGLLVMIWMVIWLIRQLIPWLRKTFNWFETTPSWARQDFDPNAEIGIFRLFLLGILTFVLADAVVIALLRPRFGFFVMIVSNYKVYPAVFLTIAYLAFITAGFKGNILKAGCRFSAALAIVIWVVSMYSYLPQISERNKYYTINGFNQEFNGYGLGHVPYSEGAQYVDSLMKSLVAKGIYQYPEKGRLIAEKAKSLNQNILADDQWGAEERGDAIYVTDKTGGVSYSRDQGQYAFVRNQERLYLFKMESRKYAGRNIFRQYDTGSDINIPHTSLLPGTYEVGIITTAGDATKGGILRKITIP